jgi:hypothetical protein
MTSAQQAALRRAVDADGPVKIPASTAAALAETYGYITAVPGGWEPSAGGRAILSRMDYDRAYRERCAEIPKDAKNWAARVMAWLACHGFIGGMDRWGKYHTAQQYAEHYAACTHAGLAPVRPEGETDWIEKDVDMAVEVLRDFDAADEKARARGCGVEVRYGVAPSHPKAKADAAVARPDGVVDLRAYRLARPDETNAP